MICKHIYGICVMLIEIRWLNAGRLLSIGICDHIPTNACNASQELTHCCLVTSYGIIELGQIDWGKGLLPYSTKPLPEAVLTNQQRSCGIHLRAISLEMLKTSFLDNNSKITNLRLQLQGSMNEAHGSHLIMLLYWPILSISFRVISLVLVPQKQLLTLYVLNFSSDNINMCLWFLSFLHTHMTLIVGIFPHVRQGPT